ncbi:MAG: histidinol-phosphate transaminase [Clostridiales Family XIII bacterium]|jgi:histidinol-phosphate aminotransferase|nr:histidinol-phosphate transaminase [Clostridiales Family XIII bacterium]
MTNDGGWQKNLIQIEPYVPGEQRSTPGLIKLNTTENPFPPSPAVWQAIRTFNPVDLIRYPDTTGEAFRNAVSECYGVEADHVFVGNGSDEVLGFAFRAFFNGERPVLFPDITYSFYSVWCRFFNIPYEPIPLDENFRILPEDYDRPNGGIVICNPNAPTGVGESRAFIENFMKKQQSSVVIVDEAYVDFGCQTAVDLTKTYENLLVCRTLSKSYSLAGMRIGFCIGSKVLIDALNAVKNSFNSYTTNRISVEVGLAALQDQVWFQEHIEKVICTRQRTVNALRALGFLVFDSEANFIFATHPDALAKDIYHDLSDHNILVRWFDKPRIHNYLRISIGTDENMQKLMDRISDFLAKKCGGRKK